MKIKNIKINQKLLPKLVSCMLVGSIATTTLTGCSKHKNILAGTILEDTCVVTFEDGSKDIATAFGTCEDNGYLHYYSRISGICFSDKSCKKSYVSGTSSEPLHHYPIINQENITKYLTSEELEKAMNGTLTDDDLITIVSRTIEPITENKTHTK